MFNSKWLECYIRPFEIVFDNKYEFKKDFHSKPTPTTIKKPQGNVILERLYQVLGDIICTETLQQDNSDVLYPWSKLLTSVAWAIYSTYHSTLKFSPSVTDFDHDMLLNIKFIDDWEFIGKRKQQVIEMKNSREKSLCIDHDYKLGHKVLIVDKGIHRKLNYSTQGPYTII